MAAVTRLANLRTMSNGVLYQHYFASDVLSGGMSFWIIASVWHDHMQHEVEMMNLTKEMHPMTRTMRKMAPAIALFTIAVSLIVAGIASIAVLLHTP